jgi:hypothetical protein
VIRPLLTSSAAAEPRSATLTASTPADKLTGLSRSRTNTTTEPSRVPPATGRPPLPAGAPGQQQHNDDHGDDEQPDDEKALSMAKTQPMAMKAGR